MVSQKERSTRVGLFRRSVLRLDERGHRRRNWEAVVGILLRKFAQKFAQ